MSAFEGKRTSGGGAPDVLLQCMKSAIGTKRHRNRAEQCDKADIDRTFLKFADMLKIKVDARRLGQQGALPPVVRPFKLSIENQLCQR